MALDLAAEMQETMSAVDASQASAPASQVHAVLPEILYTGRHVVDKACQKLVMQFYGYACLGKFAQQSLHSSICLNQTARLCCHVLLKTLRLGKLAYNAPLTLH